jgi:hypothetical protein
MGTLGLLFSLLTVLSKNICMESLLCAGTILHLSDQTVNKTRKFLSSWGWESNFNYQKVISVCHFQPSFRRGFSFTCPTFWCWLVPASLESEEVECRHHMNLPSQELEQDHCLYPRVIHQADTTREWTVRLQDKLRNKDCYISAPLWKICYYALTPSSK